MKRVFETSAGGIVFKKDGKQILWLTTKHSGYKKWTFPKGLVGDINKDEDKKEAALREVQEEGGIKAKIIDEETVKVSYTYTLQNLFHIKTVYYYLMEYVSGDTANHDWEVTEAKFAPEEELEKLLSFKSDKEAFAKIKEKLHEK